MVAPNSPRPGMSRLQVPMHPDPVAVGATEEMTHRTRSIHELTTTSPVKCFITRVSEQTEEPQYKVSQPGTITSSIKVLHQIGVRKVPTENAPRPNRKITFMPAHRQACCRPHRPRSASDLLHTLSQFGVPEQPNQYIYHS